MMKVFASPGKIYWARDGKLSCVETARLRFGIGMQMLSGRCERDTERFGQCREVRSMHEKNDITNIDTVRGEIEVGSQNVEHRGLRRRYESGGGRWVKLQPWQKL